MARSYPFLEATETALEGITRLYDFVWPTAAALWNLRWQVAGFNQVRGDATVEELTSRFIEGSGIHGANLHRACLEHSWEQHQGELARVTLVNLFAIYESWAADVVQALTTLPEKQQDALAKGLQFPTSTDPKTGKRRGVAEAVATLASSSSSTMAAEVQPILQAQPKAHPAHVDELLLFYRYFKECRNSMMHRGGVATTKAVAASADLSSLLASGKTLPFGAPATPALVLGGPLGLTLFGVVGFGELVQRLLLTLDAAFAGSTSAEVMLLARWRRAVGTKDAPADAKRRHRAVAGVLRKLGLPNLPAVKHLDALLKANGLLR